MRQGHRPKRLRNVMDIKPAETMLISSDGRGRDCSIPEAWAGYRVAEFMYNRAGIRGVDTGKTLQLFDMGGRSSYDAFKERGISWG